MDDSKLAKLMEQAARIASTPKKPTGKPCACGCSALTKGGDWLPGHNGIALGRLVRELREKGTQAQTPASEPEPTSETQEPGPEKKPRLVKSRSKKPAA